MGEVTPRMAEVIASSPALKILLPLTRAKVEIVGLIPKPLPHQVEQVVERLKEILKNV
jgi:hypothetical protein